MQLSSQSNDSTKILKKFNEEIYAIVEICIPNVAYVLFLKDRLILIDANSLETIKESETFSLASNLDKIRMIATKSEIFINDGSIIRRYNFDLEAILVSDCTAQFGYFFCFDGAIFYDDVEEEILVHVIGAVITVYRSLILFSTGYITEIDDDILFHKTSNNFIYFVMTDSTIGKYDILKDNHYGNDNIQDYELGSKVCSDGAKVVAFYAHEDESLITVCTYLNRNSTSVIILSNYGNNYQRIITVPFEIKSIVLTSNGRILASIHNKSDQSFSLVSIF
jgi:hypothetical protein